MIEDLLEKLELTKEKLNELAQDGPIEWEMLPEEAGYSVSKLHRTSLNFSAKALEVATVAFLLTARLEENRGTRRKYLHRPASKLLM
jgi:hypothetical protein